MRVQAAIEEKLNEALEPEELRLINESGNHSVPPGSESHFNAIIIASAFEGKSLVQRHRTVYAALGEELQQTIHAFTMKTFTPAEWRASKDTDNSSPSCRGGSKEELSRE